MLSLMKNSLDFARVEQIILSNKDALKSPDLRIPLIIVCCEHLPKCDFCKHRRGLYQITLEDSEKFKQLQSTLPDNDKVIKIFHAPVIYNRQVQESRRSCEEDSKKFLLITELGNVLYLDGKKINQRSNVPTASRLTLLDQELCALKNHYFASLTRANKVIDKINICLKNNLVNPESNDRLGDLYRMVADKKGVFTGQDFIDAVVKSS